MRELQIVGAISLVVILGTILLTYRSNFSKETKLLLYIMAILAPPLAFILCLVFYAKRKA